MHIHKVYIELQFLIAISTHFADSKHHPQSLLRIFIQKFEDYTLKEKTVKTSWAHFGNLLLGGQRHLRLGDIFWR